MENTASMIFQQRVAISLANPIMKVHYVTPAFHNSVVLMGLKRVGQDQLLHFDHQGKILYTINFGQLVDTFCQISDRVVMVLRVQLNQIWEVNLEQQSIIKYSHKFTIDTSTQCFLDYFCDSGLLCVREHGDNQDKTITLTYYQVPLEGFAEPQLQEQFQSGDEQSDEEQVSKSEPPDFYLRRLASLPKYNNWNPLQNTHKANLRSKYIWYSQNQSNQLSITQAELANRVVQVKNLSITLQALYEPYNLDELRISVLQFWQIRPEVFIIYTLSSKSLHASLSPGRNVVNNSFVWNIAKNTIRETLFTFDPRYHQFLIDIIVTPSFSMYRTYYFEFDKIMESPAYFINNSNETIMSQQIWKCSHLQKYHVPDYLTDTIVQASYQPLNVCEFELRIIRAGFQQEMSLFLLINMGLGPKEKGNVEDWDQDLLSDVIRSIDYDS